MRTKHLQAATHAIRATAVVGIAQDVQQQLLRASPNRRINASAIPRSLAKLGISTTSSVFPLVGEARKKV